jgi:hypothetical protein
VTLTAGQLGATQLLAQLIASIEDPHDHGIAIGEMESIEGGVVAELALPSGDRFAVSVQWVGDREADA